MLQCYHIQENSSRQYNLKIPPRNSCLERTTHSIKAYMYLPNHTLTYCQGTRFIPLVEWSTRQNGDCYIKLDKGLFHGRSGWQREVCGYSYWIRTVGIFSIWNYPEASLLINEPQKYNRTNKQPEVTPNEKYLSKFQMLRQIVSDQNKKQLWTNRNWT